MAQVVIGMGANLGDGSSTLRLAAAILAKQLDEFQVSPLYASAPMYVENQPVFTNAVAVGQTQCSPVEIFILLKSLEQQFGRGPSVRYGPRELDLDLLAFGTLEYSFSFEDGSGLVVPHPRLAERRFVLEPLAEVCPNLKVPGLPSIQSMLAEVRHQELSLIDG